MGAARVYGYVFIGITSTVINVSKVPLHVVFVDEQHVVLVDKRARQASKGSAVSSGGPAQKSTIHKG